MILRVTLMWNLIFFIGGSLLILYLSNRQIRGRIYKSLLVSGCIFSGTAAIIYIAHGIAELSGLFHML